MAVRNFVAGFTGTLYIDVAVDDSEINAGESHEQIALERATIRFHQVCIKSNGFFQTLDRSIEEV